MEIQKGNKDSTTAWENVKDDSVDGMFRAFKNTNKQISNKEK